MTPKRKTIALVDDDSTVRQALQRLLAAMDYSVAPFCSAEEFLASGRPGRFGGLLLDVHLRGMSGLELHARLTATGHHIPTIFISAAADAALDIEEQAGRESVFLPKPLDADLLLAALRQTVVHSNA